MPHDYDTDIDKELSKQIWENIKSSQSSHKDWKELATKSYNFYAGHQWSQEDLTKLNEDERPAITFNRTVRVINAVIGLEIQNRQTVAYLPREPGDAITSELLTGAVDWARDSCDAEDEESQAFKDCVICGMGWTETRIDYEIDPDGQIFVDRVDPLEMYWDPSARKRNLDDARWIARVRKYTRKEFKEFWPDAEVFLEGGGLHFDNYTPTEPIDREEARFYRSDSASDYNADRNKIDVVQYQHWEREAFYRVENGENIETLSESQFAKVKPLVEELGLTWVKQYRRRYKQSFFYGKQELESGDSPVQGFTFRCITGLTDRNNNTWFGLLQLMLDPQMYANKWLSQILYILNTNPSGGYFYESGAIANLRRFQDDLANPAKNIELNPGGLDKILPKKKPDYPQGIDKLLNYAIESINDLVGVNLEMLGVANRDQAAVLEENRKSAGITILADFFDALRRYRKEQGRVLADFVLNYISDGRLVKIAGEGLGRYVPLLKEQLNFKYDIVVDEAPTTHNSRERTFQVLSSLVPQMLQAGIPIPPDILDYAPIPADLAQKWKDMINNQQPDELEELAKQVKAQLAQLEVQEKEQDLQKGQLDMQKKNADTAKTYADINLDVAKTAHEQALATQDTKRENLQTILQMIEKIRGDQQNAGAL